MVTEEDHKYIEESKRKSEIFNIGVLQENPSTTAGVINILDMLHRYVPQNEADGTLYPIITWGDGLSCERHADAQNARANGATPRERLEGLEPSPQEFHKRMILMQETMDTLFDGRSAQDKGTLFYLKNVFNQRSVSKTVAESFNYVSDFLNFVTKGYVLLFGMDHLNMENLDDDIALFDGMDDSEQRQQLKSTAKEIVEKVWCGTTKIESNLEELAEEGLCHCKEDLDDFDEPMIECQNNDCEKGHWFHYVCVGIDEDNIPSDWFCSEECRNDVIHYKYCICKKYIKDEPMIECSYPNCEGQWFHGCCFGMTEDQFPDTKTSWYCSKTCKTKDRGKKRKKTREEEEGLDRKFEYTKILVWRGLNDMIRRKAVRSNNGEMMVLFWKMDLPLFHNGNHTKYFILGHRLITALNGWLPEGLRFDLTWNRTVNLHGGRNRNDEMDLVNEFLNREFKDSIKTAGSKYSKETLDRHGRLAGGLGTAIQEIYSSLVGGSGEGIHTRKEDRRQEDLRLFTHLLRPEKLTVKCLGRSHKAFPTIVSNESCKNVEKFKEKIKKHQKRLDKRRKVALN
ncbi:uncharacterized protein LOC132743654 [Ruditapes philippinarum]|uniref:uncharacterized protein LOC132743654 n=1 Tax=Ruditapes philippinarum TaxID=129788 RepID=UPI00295C0E02|nr:uncharacterized protein LOC132743654 [Ruditapes philippinarum]